MGFQAFIKTLPGVVSTESGRANGATDSLNSAYDDCDRVAVEVMPLKNYVKSAEEHQDRLDKHPGDYCHIPAELLNKYRKEKNL